jgi:hypothetical protein
MIDITEFIKLFTDKSLHWVQKTFTAFLFVFLFLFLDNLFDFSYSFRTNNHIEQLSKITTLLKDTSLSENSKKNLLKERECIISKKTYFESFLSLGSSLSLKNPFESDKKQYKSPVIQSANPKLSEKEVSEPIKNFYLHYLFSNLFTILLMFMFPFALIRFGNIRSVSLGIATLLIIWVILFLIGLLFAFIFGLIPTFKNVSINYLIDAALHCIVVCLILLAGAKSNKIQSELNKNPIV